MALYKPYCDSNDYELPSGQATPSILARGVACDAYGMLSLTPWVVLNFLTAAALPCSAAYSPVAPRPQV